MMKRLFLLLFTLLPGLLFADNIPQQKAQEIAQQFFAATARTRSASLRMIWDGESHATRSTAHPAYYVFNNESGRGFVIVSGDDRTVPILGYSFDQNFDAESMPSNLRGWMTGLREHVNTLRAQNALPSTRTVKAWHEAVTGPNPSAKPVVVLETALWDQRDPYNSHLAKPNEWVTGCPATAIAIIMRYHKWPEKGVGTIPQYRDEIPPITLGHTYDWDNMPLNYKVSMPTQEQKDQVGILMRDVGAMIRTEYRGGTAGANPEQTLPQLMPIFMRYNASTIKSYFKKDFNDAKWHQMMQKELQEKRPVLYGGYSSGGGHQFVLDGYAEGNYYHVNWGWSGVSNGYYLLTDMNPPEQGTGGSTSSTGFVNKQDAIIGIQPDPSNPGGRDFDLIVYKQYWEGHEYGLICKETEFTPGKEFIVTIKEFRNVGSRSFRGTIAIAHCDAQGKVKSIISARNPNYSNYPIDIAGFTETNPLKCTITEPIEAGDRIMGVFKYLDPSEWTPIDPGTVEGCISEILLKEGGEPEPEPEPTDDLAEHVSMEYDKALACIEIFTESADEVKLQLLQNGQDKTSGFASATDKGFKIETASLKGECTIRLTSAKRGSVEFKVVL